MSRERREESGAGPSRTTRRAVLAGGAGLAAGIAGITGAGATDSAGAGARRAVRQSGGAWPSFKNGPANTGYAEGRSAPVANVGTAWTFDAGAAIRTAPAVVGGSVYVGADDGRLYAVDAATGEFRWRYGTGSTVRGSPAVADSVVAFGAQDATYHALSTSDGTRQWITTFGDTTLANRPSAVLDGTVYFGTGAARTEGVGEVYAHDLASGDRLWEQSDVTPGGSPTPVGGSVFVGDVGSRGPAAVELAAADGSVARREYMNRGGPTTPAVVDGRKFVPSSGSVLVLDSDIQYDGKYTIPLEDRSLATSVAVAADTLFAVDRDGTVVAIATDQVAENRIRWAFDTGSTARRSPVVAGSTLFVGCEDGTVYGIDASTGEERWRFGTGGAVRGPPAVAGGRVYVGSADGTLYALTGETDDTTLTSVEGTATPTPTRSPSPEPTESPSPTPTRSPTPDRTPTREPTPVPERTVTPTATRTPTERSSPEPTATPSGGSVGGSDADGEGGRAGDGGGAGGTTSGTAPAGEDGRNDAAVGGGPLPGVAPTDLLFGVGGAAALGGGLLGVRRLFGDDEGADAGSGSDAATTGDDPSDAGADSPTGTGAGPPTGTGSPDDAPGTGPETVDLDAVRGDAVSAPDAVSYEGVERVRELDRVGRAVAYEALVPTVDGEHRVELRQPAFEGTLDAGVVERFADAAGTWAALGEHDNVVGVVDWGTEPLPWLALEYHERDLAALAGELSPAAAAALATGIVEGVHHGHSRGLTHLGIRPGAVLVAEGSPPWAAVGDWGLTFGGGRLAERAPAYAAPEQFDGEAAGRATDVYGLGATLYELFTGRPPFEESTPTVAEATRKGTAPRPTAVDDSLPAGVDTVIGRAMALDPADRYEDVLYLRDALAALE